MDITAIIARLSLLGHARRRDIDPELRVITINDDEAVALTDYIESLVKGGDSTSP